MLLIRHRLESLKGLVVAFLIPVIVDESCWSLLACRYRFVAFVDEFKEKK